MDYKLLGKAMGFMFMPTLGVLLMLLIGFFDPIAMWNFIKSDNGWAVVVRVVLFITEAGLITGMYLHYVETEAKKKALEGKVETEPEGIYDTYEVRRLFSYPKGNSNYYMYKTADSNLIVIKRTE